MPRFLIEIPHEADKSACLRAAQILLSTGSHYLTNADFGCMSGEHKAWLIVDVPSQSEATAIVPVPYRSQAKCVELTRFRLERVEELLRQHEGQSA